MGRALTVRDRWVAVAYGAIVLGSGRGTRYLDPNRSFPTSIQGLSGGGRVLDWQLNALGAAGIDRQAIRFVGGYHIEKVVRAYADLRFFFHEAWDHEGDAGALLAAEPVLEGDLILTRTDAIFRAEAVRSLLALDTDVAVARIGSSASDPLALVRVAASATSRFAQLLARGSPKASLEELVALWATQVGVVAEVDVSPHAAPVRDATSVARFVLGTKAQTLQRLRPLLTRSIILDQVRFRIVEWRRDPEAVRRRVLAELRDGAVAVRSTSAFEDTWSASGAGRFPSILDVDPHDPLAFAAAVDRVIEGYGAIDPERAEVFVQPFLRDVSASGVILTRDLETGGPYYVVTLDRRSGRTDTVTGGHPQEHETVYVHRGALHARDPLVDRLVGVAREIESLVGHDCLDIEFAVDDAGICHLLQTRPLVRSSTTAALADEDVAESLALAKAHLSYVLARCPGVAGRPTLLSNMADWNPAEMIGVAPGALARSLYQTLITDRAWALARAAMGYRDVSGHPLLVNLAGVPYVDVRASLNSFLPASLDDAPAERIVDRWIEHLAADPHLHDKVEFEIAITCLTFDHKLRIDALSGGQVRERDVDALGAGLLDLTDALVKQQVASIGHQLAQLERLSARRARIVSPDRSIRHAPMDVRWLVQDCIELGTVPFAILARHAFVALAFLRSMTAVGILSDAEHERVLANIPTVATEVSDGLDRLARDPASRAAFDALAGHLRPGTYDILSPRYASLRFAPIGQAERARARPDREEARRILASHRQEIAQRLHEAGLTCTPEQLTDYILEAIAARERAKFEFTKNVDAILELVAAHAASLGLSRKEAASVHVSTLLRLAAESPSGAVEMELRRESGFEEKRSLLAAIVRLPSLVASLDDLEGFVLPPTEPNFASMRRVQAEPIEVTPAVDPAALRGRIAVLRQADPGYDWIFAHGIVGLVTQYGGVGSHMAIRAAEFSLPSVIGCGEALYARASRARLLEIDGGSRRLKVIE